MTRKAWECVGVALIAVCCVLLLIDKINYVVSQNAALTAQVAALEGRLGKILEERIAPISAQLNSVTAKVSTDLPSKDSLGNVEQQLKVIDGKLIELISRLVSIEQQSKANDGKLSDLTAKLVSIEEESSATAPPEEEQHTTADAKDRVTKLGQNPAAEDLAETLAMIDTWLVKPDEEKQFVDYKQELAGQLRGKVKQEVDALQKESLGAKTGAEAARKHAEAGSVLAFYPMSEDSKIIEEAKQLSAQQAELATRLEVIRRQRYNRWATEQIEKAIDGYNAKSSYWKPQKENTELINSLVQCLGEVDPALLEPVVLELYSYVVDLTKASISEKEKLDLAKGLSDPATKRKTMGDF